MSKALDSSRISIICSGAFFKLSSQLTGSCIFFYPRCHLASECIVVNLYFCKQVEFIVTMGEMVSRT